MAAIAPIAPQRALGFVAVRALYVLALAWLLALSAGAAHPMRPPLRTPPPGGTPVCGQNGQTAGRTSEQWRRLG
jgi:hypothetical protein